MPKHTCHALRCENRCAPRLLMCPICWGAVPLNLQKEVLRTVRIRGTRIDKTWAPWWRAQAQATASIAPENIRDRYLKRELEFAEKLEARE